MTSETTLANRNVKIEKKCKIVCVYFSKQDFWLNITTLSDAIHVASVDFVHLKKYICVAFFKLLNTWR